MAVSGLIDRANRGRAPPKPLMHERHKRAVIFQRRCTVAVCSLVACLAQAVGAQTPTVSGVSITSSPDSGDTYELGEVIWASVTFDQALDVTGRPQLALTIGTVTRQMNSLPVAGSIILFAYEVQSSDADANGVGIGANALTLNGGTIRARGGTMNATLGLGAHAIANAANHKVDGSRETVPTVNRVNLVNLMYRGTYKLGQDIFATVTFNRPVDVTGSPQLALTVGSATRQADYSPSDSVGRVIWFVYTVQSSDSDDDGISIGADALALNGGTIRIRGGTANAALGLGAHAIANSVHHKVDGGQEADDDDEGESSNSPDNAAPGLVGELAALQLEAGETTTVDLAAAFDDPDDDALSYSVLSDSTAVSVQLVSGKATIHGIRPGEARITITATDPYRLDASATFKVTVGTLLSLSGYAAAPEGGTVALRAVLSRALAEPLDISWRIMPDDDPSTPDADAGDYESSGATMIPAGLTSAAIEIVIIDDDIIEPAWEYLVVELGPPTNANVGHARSARTTAVIQEGVCDRTLAVRDELARNWQACYWPRPSDLANVSTLTLSGRGIDTLGSRDLLGLNGLLSLDLSDNALAALPTNLLSEAPRLRNLDLSGNALETLPDGLFAGLGQLLEVSVEGNPGAPFGVAVELARTDAESWRPGPATVSAGIAIGAPFALAAPLTISPAATNSDVEAPSMVTVAAGETTGAAFTAASVAGGPLVLRADAAPMPTARCGDTPCFRGFETMPSATLTLFRRPPQALVPPPTEPLRQGDALRLPLSSLIVPGEASDAMRWAASSSDDSVATAHFIGADLVVEPEPGSEGTTTITVTATDSWGLAATTRFDVQVQFHWPLGPARGWRAIMSATAQDAGASAR